MKEQIPPDHHDRVMHVTLAVDGAVLMGSDAPSPEPSRPHGISVSLAKIPVEEGARVFKALSEGGTITMPFEKTFWSSGFGMLVDRYGIPWMVSCS
jgi:PhnB protein